MQILTYLGDRLSRPAAGGTLCHMLWDSAFIDQHGDVYACCHSMPGPVGNIYKESLAAIWTGSDKLGRFRAQSLGGRLRCAPDCNILTAGEKSGAERHPAYPDHPNAVWILFGELCNVRCIMCPQDHKSKIMLDAEVLRQQVDWPKVQNVELLGGEILAIKNGMTFYAWLTGEMSKKVNVITNGLLITPRWADQLVAGGEWIQVSVNAATRQTHELVNEGSRFDNALRGVRLLVASKRQCGPSGAEIIFKYTIVPQNAHELADGIALASELGCDGIAYGFSNEVPAFLKANPELAGRLKAQVADALRANPQLSVERKRLRHLGLLPAEAMAE